LSFKTFIFAFVICLGWVGPARASDAQGLVQWFCRAQLSAAQNGSPLHTDESRWNEMKQSLLSHTLSRQSIDPSLDESDVNRCTERYRADFEQAEFILRGLRVIDQSLHAKTEPKPMSSFSATVEVEGFSVTTALVETANDEIDAVAVKNRRQNYLKLWNAFAENLRERVGSTFVAGQ